MGLGIVRVPHAITLWHLQSTEKRGVPASGSPHRVRQRPNLHQKAGLSPRSGETV